MENPASASINDFIEALKLIGGTTPNMQTINKTYSIVSYVKLKAYAQTDTVSITLPQTPIVAYVQLTAWIDEYSGSSTKQNIRGSKDLYMKLTQGPSYTSALSSQMNNAGDRYFVVYGMLYGNTIKMYAYRDMNTTMTWYGVVTVTGIDIIW